MKKRTSERGSALMMVTVVVLIIVGTSGAYLTSSWYFNKRADLDAWGLQALYIAESGAAIYLEQVNHPKGSPTTPGRPAPALTPVALSGGSYFIPSQATPLSASGIPLPPPASAPQEFIDYGTLPATDPSYDPNYLRFKVYGVYNGVVRKLDVLVTSAAGGVYWNAVWAGNSSADPGYTMGFASGDQVAGNMYFNGAFAVTGTPTFTDYTGTGNSRVTLSPNTASPAGVTGALFSGGTEPPLAIQRSLPPPNLTGPPFNKDPNTAISTWEIAAAQNWNGNRQDANGTAYIDVAHDLAAMGATGSWVDNSSAVQIADRSQPSHIFRMNPTSDYSTTDRTQAYEYTNHAKNDYYLEDPTAGAIEEPSLTGVPVNGDPNASMVHVQSNGNNAVYFVDGNMRVSGEQIKSYQLNPDPGMGSLSMTFVVKGNVSMTDNILYPSWQSQSDAVGIIAIQDPLYPNVDGSYFASNPTTALLPPYGPTGTQISIAQFVSQFNAFATTARGNGSNIQNLDFTNPADFARAAQEYNKSYGSGNMYWGDPGSGTVEHFEGYMYAENNFYATDLDSTKANGGTHEVEIWGNMTAGNQVSIVRNVSSSGTGYTPLKVLFDPAIMLNKAKPPALPQPPGFSGSGWTIANWKLSP